MHNSITETIVFVIKNNCFSNQIQLFSLMKSIMVKTCGYKTVLLNKSIKIPSYSHWVPFGSFTTYPHHIFVMYLREQHNKNTYNLTKK
ncbi:hypothetical protein HMPREF1212_04474 [Parabacteroides sp. HGS0025]|nr:hypothetical protein HMPREF1212_04474 [Parabacteroides sp. HGS0025]